MSLNDRVFIANSSHAKRERYSPRNELQNNNTRNSHSYFWALLYICNRRLAFTIFSSKRKTRSRRFHDRRKPLWVKFRNILGESPSRVSLFNVSRQQTHNFCWRSIWVFKMSSSENRSRLSVTCLRYRTIVLLLLSLQALAVLYFERSSPGLAENTSNVRSAPWNITLRFLFLTITETTTNRSHSSSFLQMYDTVFKLPSKISRTVIEWNFHTYLEYSAKGVKEWCDRKGSVRISTRFEELQVFLVQIAGKSNLYHRRPRMQKKSYYTVTDAIVLSIFFTQVAISTTI